VLLAVVLRLAADGLTKSMSCPAGRATPSCPAIRSSTVRCASIGFQALIKRRLKSLTTHCRVDCASDTGQQQQAVPPAHLHSVATCAAGPALPSSIIETETSVQEEWRGEIIQLSWQPRSYLLKGFLTHEECDHLIGMAKPSMRKSSVADSSTGKSVDSNVRTSTGTFLSKGQDEVVTRIERRTAQARRCHLQCPRSRAHTLNMSRRHFCACQDVLPIAPL
jgi:hypothetical protein